MIGNKNGRAHLYTCNRRQRQGREVCQQPSIVSHTLHAVITDWLKSNVLTAERLVGAREELNRKLNRDKKELREHQSILLGDSARIEKRIQNLIDVIEDNGSTPEIETRLGKRRAEKQDIELQLIEVERGLKQQRVTVSDDALAYLARNLCEALESGNPEKARAVMRFILKRVELYRDKIIAQYVFPLGDIENQTRVGFSVCPHGNSNPSFGLERATS